MAGPPVACLALVCRDAEFGGLTAPVAQWEALIPHIAALGVDVTLIRRGHVPATRRYLRGPVVVREVPLTVPREAPRGADAALWAQAAAHELAAADHWRRVTVVEAPVRGGELVHAGDALRAARVLRDDGHPPGEGLDGALAAVAAQDADRVAPPPVVMLAALRPGPAAEDVVIVGPRAAALAAALGQAGIRATAPAPVTVAGLVAALRRAAVAVLDGPGQESVAATALAAGVPVIGTTDLVVGPARMTATPAATVALADAVLRLRDDAATRRAVRAAAPAVRAATHPRAVALGLLAEYASLPRRRAGEPVRLGGALDGAGRPPGIDAEVEGWRVRCAAPCAVSPGWRRTLPSALSRVPQLCRAGPVGYVWGADGVLRRLPPGDRPCDVLWDEVTAGREGGDGRVWQIAGPWPATARQAPPVLPDPDVDRHHGSRVAAVHAGGGFHGAEAVGDERPRWMTAGGVVTAEVPASGDWWLVLDAESFVTPRTLAVEGPAGTVETTVPAGARALRHLRMRLSAGPVRLWLTTDPGPDTPARVLGVPDPRPLSIRLWGAQLERAG